MRIKSMTNVNILTIQRFLGCIPYLIFLLSISFIIKSADIRGEDPNKIYEDSIYIDTALVTMEAIFRTLLWFLILLLSFGWKISIQSLNTRDTKFMMKMVLIIYIIM